MSEILIYKANECTAKLDEATDIVNAEIHRYVVTVYWKRLDFNVTLSFLVVTL